MLSPHQVKNVAFSKYLHIWVKDISQFPYFTNLPIQNSKREYFLISDILEMMHTSIDNICI